VSKKSCYKCGAKDKRLYSTFGKYICLECLQKRRTGRKGHSGMIYDPLVREEDYYSAVLKDKPLHLELVKKSNKLFVKWFIEHYPESKGIVGRQLNFLIYRYGRPIGIIGFASPPLNYRKFNFFFGLSGSSSDNAKRFLNNNVFRIVYTERNLGTQVLKLAREKVRKLYEQKYGDALVGLVTFVELPRNGAIYKADNWVYLGVTEGIRVRRRGMNWVHKQYRKGIQKYIFGYRYK